VNDGGKFWSWHCSEIIVQYFLFENNLTSIFTDVSCYKNINNGYKTQLEYPIDRKMTVKIVRKD
jgi:hypothetical protein